MTQQQHTIVESPIGDLTLVGTDLGLRGLFMPGHRPAPDETTFGERDDDAFAEARAQLAAYFAGELDTFDVALDVHGTDFQRRVWHVLQTIPYGETRTYGWIAEQIAQPSAVRAVGLANARNPVSIIVPCHRVIGSTGALTGYAGGFARKQALLDLESGARLDFVA